jgi:hypothetical protein
MSGSSRLLEEQGHADDTLSLASHASPGDQARGVTDKEEVIRNLFEDADFSNDPDSPNLLTRLLGSAETSAEEVEAPAAAQSSRGATVRWELSEPGSDACSSESRLSTFSMHLARCGPALCTLAYAYSCPHVACVRHHKLRSRA